jgi:hypothetical protein
MNAKIPGAFTFLGSRSKNEISKTEKKRKIFSSKFHNLVLNIVRFR